MELAEPSISTAFDAAAAERHPGVCYLVTAPLGPHPLLMDVVEDRIDSCLEHALGTAPESELCAGTEDVGRSGRGGPPEPTAADAT